MLKISNINIKGFKYYINEFNVKLDDKNIIVGSNSSGKSLFVSFIKEFFDVYYSSGKPNLLKYSTSDPKNIMKVTFKYIADENRDYFELDKYIDDIKNKIYETFYYYKSHIVKDVDDFITQEIGDRDWFRKCLIN